MNDFPHAIPDHWIWKTIGEIGEIHSGSTPSTKDDTNFGGEIAWLTPADLSGYGRKYISGGSRSLTQKGLDSCSAVLLPEGSILFSSRAPVGYTVIAAAPISTNQGFKNLIPGGSVTSDYVYHYLKGNKALAESYASGTTFTELSATRFSRIPVPVPPLPEQRRIVAKIEKLFSDLDAGVADLKRAQQQLQRYRQSVLQAAVEGRLTKDWRKQHGDVETRDLASLRERILEERRTQWEKDYRARYEAKDKKPPNGWKKRYKEPEAPDTSDLPELPEEWCWATVNQMATVSTGATPLRRESKYWTDGTIPWVKSGALNNLFVKKAEEKITEVALKETNVKLFPPHTLLIAMYGEGKTRGKVSELLVKATTNQACAAIITEGTASEVKPYLKLFFQKNYDDIRRLSSGGVQPNLNLGIIRSTSFPLPPLEEQRQIVSEVERLLSVADDAAQTVERELKRAERLRQSILKEAFAGRLVPQNGGGAAAPSVKGRQMTLGI